MSKFLLANITWNPFGWRNNNYINPKAGHTYAKVNVGGESLNFNFNKKTIDTDIFVHGYVQWTNSPKKFEKDGLIFFYTNNTDIHKGQIIGVFGQAETFDKVQTHKVPFQDRDYSANIKAQKNFSLLFPVPLNADNYKENKSNRLVPQVGYTYKDKLFADQILLDELNELLKAGTNEADFNKLVAVYEYYIGKAFVQSFISSDEKEQTELVEFFERNKSKDEIIADIENLMDSDTEEVIINHKAYKRDNKTIAQLKILRDFKCQICGNFILKKDGSKYIEAAHIIAKCLKGRETPDNIILLCPNHHKEFDLGERQILKTSPEQIIFILNGERYELKVSIR